MLNPHDLLPPEEPIAGAAALARDLAYGVISGLWEPTFFYYLDYQGNRIYEVTEKSAQPDDYLIPSQLSPLRQYLHNKWRSIRPPSAPALQMLGYLERIEDPETRAVHYLLTTKALRLLEAPAEQLKVFIAYARQSSSAFTLLIEARLQARGAAVFIDKMLNGGEEWEARIHHVIAQQIDTFICLIAPGTLESPNVCQEIRWAMQADAARDLTMIPLWHQGYQVPGNGGPAHSDPLIAQFLTKKNAIRVLEESALAYESALVQLLNQLQFAAEDDRLLH